MAFPTLHARSIFNLSVMPMSSYTQAFTFFSQSSHGSKPIFVSFSPSLFLFLMFLHLF